jgi:hypothetical protein
MRVVLGQGLENKIGQDSDVVSRQIDSHPCPNQADGTVLQISKQGLCFGWIAPNSEIRPIYRKITSSAQDRRVPWHYLFVLPRAD